MRRSGEGSRRTGSPAARELTNSDRHAIGDAFEVFVLPFADDPELVPALEVVEPEPIEP